MKNPSITCDLTISIDCLVAPMDQADKSTSVMEIEKGKILKY